VRPGIVLWGLGDRYWETFQKGGAPKGVLRHVGVPLVVAPSSKRSPKTKAGGASAGRAHGQKEPVRDKGKRCAGGEGARNEKGVQA